MNKPLSTPRRLWLPAVFCILALAALFLPSCGKSTPRQPQEAKRLCIWLLWLGEPELAREAAKRLKQGEHFMVVAKDMPKRHPEKAKANADCVPASGLSPQVKAALAPLELGQVSPPFELNQGTAYVMRTTDEYRKKGQELYEKRRFQEAEELFLKDLALHPASPPTWHVVALCRTGRGDYKGALEALDQALAWTPDNPALLNDKASALALAGRPKQALLVFERAHQLAPNSPMIKANLARALYTQKHDLARAERLARAAVNADPQNAWFRETLAQIQAAGRGGKKAKAALKAAPPKRRPASTADKPTPKPAASPSAKTAPAPGSPRVAQKPRAEKPKAGAKQLSPPRADSKPAQKASRAKRKRTYIQVASFRKRALAQKEISLWLKRGYAGRLGKWRVKSGRVYYRVLLGPYSSRYKAKKQALRLKKKGRIKSYVLIESSR